MDRCKKAAFNLLWWLSQLLLLQINDEMKSVTYAKIDSDSTNENALEREFKEVTNESNQVHEPESPAD